MQKLKIGSKKPNIKLDKRVISALFSVLCSLVIIIMGVVVISNANGLTCNLYISDAYVSKYSFGADFYTEMYNVTYKAVEQLQNLSSGVETGFTRVLIALRAAVKGIGVLVVALGIFSLMRSVPVAMELLPEKKAKAQEPAAAVVENTEAVEDAEVVEFTGDVEAGKEAEPVEEEQETTGSGTM